MLRTYYPRRLAAYYEPFLGSGAVFFDLLAAGRLAGVPVWLSDGNPDLVGCYLRVRDSVEAVIGALDDLAAGHAAGGATFYYEVRDGRFNPARAAWAAAGPAGDLRGRAGGRPDLPEPHRLQRPLPAQPVRAATTCRPAATSAPGS